MTDPHARVAGRLLAALALLVTLTTAAQRSTTSHAAAQRETLHYKNPVFSPRFPDPMVLRISAHNYYAYATQTPWEKKRAIFPILHSSDLVHWKYVGDIFKKAPSWASGDFWAPNVIRQGKTYYAYYTGSFLSVHCIAVATAGSPSGPFKHRSRIGCGDEKGTGYIDPDLFVDKDGKAYLYVSVDAPQHNISVIPLKKDLLHPAGPRKEVLGVTQAWEHGQNRATVEAPFVIRQGSTYYLFFSGNDWEDNYAMGYATSSSPTGPFTAYSGNPIMKGDAHVFGPGGGSVVEGPDGKLWMAYHAWPSATGHDVDKRDLRIDPLVWNGSTVTVPVTP